MNSSRWNCVQSAWAISAAIVETMTAIAKAKDLRRMNPPAIIQAHSHRWLEVPVQHSLPTFVNAMWLKSDVVAPIQQGTSSLLPQEGRTAPRGAPKRPVQARTGTAGLAHLIRP